MNYNIKSIPTEYSGVMFRSRLEASWAAFFDYFRIEWEYEPFELDGWFPDFKIWNSKLGNGEILVEVKPYKLDQFDKDFMNRIVKAYDGLVLCLGQSPLDNMRETLTTEVIGILTNRVYLDDIISVSHNYAVLLRNGDISPYYSPKEIFSERSHRTEVELKSTINFAWRKARNETQWKKKPFVILPKPRKKQ